MRTWGRARATAVALTSVLAVAVAGGAHGAPSARNGPGAEPGQGVSWRAGGAAEGPGARTVTLLTGDRVTVDARGQVIEVTARPGREKALVDIQELDGHTYAVPSDARRLLARGVLDRRLFDVTGLLEAGYGDDARKTLPLIVTYRGQRADQVRSTLRDAGVEVRRALPVVHGDAVTVPKATPAAWDALTRRSGAHAEELTSGVAAVWLDGVRRASLDRSVPQIGAPTAWDAGFTGEGVKVAVLDTGVDQGHPDLAGVEVAEKNFSESPDTVDRNGHGTHVASTVAGSGARSSGQYRGVAPGARILDAKVLADDGWGADSAVIAGMGWAVEQGAKVVNLSLGSPDRPGTDPLEEAVDRLSRDHGVLFVIAAGNDGTRGVDSPGSAEQALTVGAVDREDRLAPFSGVGPTAAATLKPDLTAPGVGIVAARSTQVPQGQEDSAPEGYQAASGTSMATPHVAGAAALLAQQHPDWTGQQLKRALTSSAEPTAGLTADQQGTGRTAVGRAVNATVVSESPALDFGVQRWPHQDDEPVARTVTYRNHGSASVTLSLSVGVAGPDGQPSADGMITLSTQRLTVPAGGTAGVEVTADTRVAAADGRHSGALVATADDQAVRTALAVTREAESYDVTLDVTGDDGKPTSDFFAELWNLDEEEYTEVRADLGESRTVRLPRGTYTVSVSTLVDPVMMIWPKLTVDRDTTTTFDIRRAKHIRVTAPDPQVAIAPRYVSFRVTGERATLQRGMFGIPDLSWLRIGHAGPEVPDGEFKAYVAASNEGGGTGYSFVHSREGRFFDGFEHQVTMDELARIDVTSAVAAPGKSGRVSAWWSDGHQQGTGGPALVDRLPGSGRHYVTTPPGVEWGFHVRQLDANGDTEVAQYDGPLHSYQAGQGYRARANPGVYGPAVGLHADSPVAYREKNSIDLCPSMFGDGQGRLGESVVTSARAELTIDDRTVLELDEVPCGTLSGAPEELAGYRLDVSASRDTAVSELTTRSEATWTFSSEHTDTRTSLPLSSVRFSPELSLTGTAEAGETLRVPVTVDGAARSVGTRSLSVEVSYDGGGTWRAVPVGEDDGKLHVELEHPNDGGSVSLRADLTDQQGNSVSQSIIDAYRLVR
ncbi:S8 family serine peptidase [Wenjunlia vitaminophila]|uniref:S8 family serine peptidase n=1 Tax=Wenjunlia vitaminophila TaxID=76728 RepID=UPI000475ACFA|nr:S8 family serine peptidase [Wenjunlia vitaminophila]